MKTSYVLWMVIDDVGHLCPEWTYLSKKTGMLSRAEWQFTGHGLVKVNVEIAEPFRKHWPPAGPSRPSALE